MKKIYLDNAATTRPFGTVVDKINQVMLENYGNPSSLHLMGIEAEREVNSARERVSELMRKDSNKVYFTSGGTESDNWAICGAIAGMRDKGRVVTSSIEHKAVLAPMKKLSEDGYDVQYIKVDSEGVIDLNHLTEILNVDTQLVSIMHVNNEVGSIQPIKEVIELMKNGAPNALLHVDAVQSFGKLELDYDADFISVSAHKLHGPKGIGALYIKDIRKIKPFIEGGGQEQNLRSGTENVPAIAGFGTACESTSITDNYLVAKELKEATISYFESNYPTAVITSPKDGLPNILSVSFPAVPAEVLIHALEDEGIYISAGAACSEKQQTPSHVLTAMGYINKIVDSNVRISFSAENTLEEVNYANNIICRTASKLATIMR